MTGYQGLGWPADYAHALVADLISGITSRSNGGTLGNHYPDGNPPLDHEDGMVYGACRAWAGDDPLAQVYCVTRDKGFLMAYRDKRLTDHSRVMTPSTFVQLIRLARSQASMRRMGPR